MSPETFQRYIFGSFCVFFLVYLLQPGLPAARESSNASNKSFPSDLTSRPHNPKAYSFPNFSSSIDSYSLTAIIPVTSNSIPHLRDILAQIVHPDFASVRLREVLLVSQDHIAPELRAALLSIMSQIEFSKHIQCSLRSWPSTASESEALMNAASSASVDWLLILDETGLSQIDPSTRKSLLNPPPTTLPLGPRGVLVSHNSSCLHPSAIPQRASYLLPPFVMTKSLTFHVAAPGRSWAAFGSYISSVVSGDIYSGGIVLPQLSTDTYDPRWCPLPPKPTPQLHHPGFDSLFGEWEPSPFESSFDDDDPATVFAILLPSEVDLLKFVHVACHLEQSHHTLHVRLYEAEQSQLHPEVRVLQHSFCTISYRVLPVEESPSAWLNDVEPKPAVILTLGEMADPSQGCSSATVIRIPEKDLVHSGWMASLTSREWRDWNVPKITLSIITKDRPQSLARLLSSISSAKFYGDQVDLRLNLEQSSDLETMDTVKSFRWYHGSLFVHHRIIHGGLLTAVVESWFPHSNDTYGVLLEDDVELSPLFYAWIKMVLLRYRYGSNVGNNSQLFGISLYQPKNIELDVTGRRPFNASHIFLSNNAHAFTPYLSQIPCSWGAVYFPEHWQEFHSYLSARFSESVFNLTQIIVPNVRSNQWTRSWKKYFIELVYLRGYVMLYPNFPDFVSLSTNHLEVGSHVKFRSKEKQESFLVPLMKLSGDANAAGLLDLPNRTLPAWSSLPVLNLTGSPTTLDELTRIGRSRRSELTCGNFSIGRNFDIDDFLCLDVARNTLDGSGDVFQDLLM